MASIEDNIKASKIIPAIKYKKRIFYEDGSRNVITAPITIAEAVKVGPGLTLKDVLGTNPPEDLTGLITKADQLYTITVLDPEE